MTTESPEALKDKGLKLFQQEDYPAALDAFQHAQEGFLAAGKPLDAAEMLNNQGVVHRMEGRLDEAAEMLKQAGEQFRSAGDISRAAQTQANLAPILSKQKRYQEAVTAYRSAIEDFGTLGDKPRQGETMMALGVLQFDNGERDLGLANYEAGIMMIEKPTGQQKRLRQLLKLRRSLPGGF